MIKCECLRLDDRGRGISKINDKITFINNLLPEEIALVKITSSKKKYNEAKITKLIKKSDNRIEPKCPLLNCGCHLKHLSYKKQLDYKEKKVKDILYKFGDIDIPLNKIVFDKNINNYRNKITLKVKDKVGYYSNKSNDFICINRCELVSNRINDLINVLNTLDLSKAKEITIKDFDELMVIINGEIDISKINAENIYMNDKLVKGNPYIQTSLNDLKFKISKDSFFQVNKYVTEKLYEIAINYLDASKDETVLDLYCGTGTISLLLSKYFKKAIGIEINKEAIECANINKKLNNINNVDFICGDASLEIKKVRANKLIVDPPRSGLSKEGINDILKMKPSIMVYISCDPITLARDLKLLSSCYDVVSVTPVDMFPNTYHVETIVKLVRKK